MTHAGRAGILASTLVIAATVALAAGASACSGCSRTAEPTPVASSSADSGRPGQPSWLAHPSLAVSAPPVPSDDPRIFKPGRDPDMDLDPNDPASDYVRRYAAATKRYGDKLGCIDIEPSKPAGDKRSVEVRNAVTCPTPQPGQAAGAVRDVFMVDVASDHLSLDDPSKREPLERWPDGSDPEGPPAPKVREINDTVHWKAPLNDAIRAQLLVPMRLQTYGRGSYPVVTLAGWYGVVQPGASTDTLRPMATALCAGNDGMPLGLVTAMDRSRILRIRCDKTGPSTRWQSLSP
jgi:hypothetical protein